MLGEIEGSLFALVAVVQVDGSYNQLILLGLGFRDDMAFWIDDHRARYQWMFPIIDTRARGGDAEHCQVSGDFWTRLTRVGVCMCLDDHCSR